MDNNIVDINYTLKTLQLKDTTDENNKEIKTIDRTFLDLVRLDNSSQATGDAFMAQTIILGGATSFISLSTMRGFTPSNIYNNNFYVSSNNTDFLNKYFRATCLDNDYNEFYQYGYTNATDSTIGVQLPIACRGVNDIELMDASYLNTAGTIYRFLIVDYYQVDAGITYRIRYTAKTINRSYRNIYIVPNNKKIKLVNIDNYLSEGTTSGNTVQQVIFKKQSSNVLVNSLFSNQGLLYNQLNIVNNNWVYEGDVIIYQQQTTSTNTALNSSYEIQNI